MNVIFHARFKKRLRKMPQPVQSAFEARLIIFMDNPTEPVLSNHSLHGKYQGYKSINVTGDYRAIFKELNQNLAEFFEIGTHSYLYS